MCVRLDDWTQNQNLIIQWKVDLCTLVSCVSQSSIISISLRVSFCKCLLGHFINFWVWKCIIHFITDCCRLRTDFAFIFWARKCTKFHAFHYRFQIIICPPENCNYLCWKVSFRFKCLHSKSHLFSLRFHSYALSRTSFYKIMLLWRPSIP